MNSIVDFPILTPSTSYTQLELQFDSELSTLFSWMHPAPRPCFNSLLLEEIKKSESLLELNQGYFNNHGSQERADYIVFGSHVPGVFNLGGDLGMFIEAILRKDRDLLTYYGDLCIENQFRRATGLGASVTTIALVQGKALGGGFEAALACDLIVAERSATMSFPEVLFNLFPGMGALSFLARKVGMRKAEDIVTSGQIYTAKEMHEIGVIDELVEDGLGLETTRRIIQAKRRKQNTHRAISIAKKIVQPIQRDELQAIVNVWVDSAMRLDTRDLRMMARLVRAQDKLISKSHEDCVVESLFEPQEMLAVSNG